LAAVWVLRRFTSSRVGKGKSIRALIISLMAFSAFKTKIPK
jgi:flagellar biogenesis protein FliO